MARSCEIRARVDAVLSKKAQARSNHLGITMSDYLRGLVEQDLQQGGQADALAKMTAEVALTSAMMIRQLLNHAFGPEEAMALDGLAKDSAMAMVDEMTNGARPR